MSVCSVLLFASTADPMLALLGIALYSVSTAQPRFYLQKATGERVANTQWEYEDQEVAFKFLHQTEIVSSWWAAT